MILNTHDLIAAFAANHLVITPNQHLSHTLLQSFFKNQSKTIQTRPTCLPFPSFLKTCYSLLTQQHAWASHPILLNTLQTQALWKQTCLTLTPDCAPTLIEAAFSAWQLTKMWQLPIENPQFTLLPQTALLQTWALQFEENLTERHFFTEQHLTSYLLDFSLTLPYQGIVFACFDDFNPMQTQLQTYFSQHHLPVQYYDLEPIQHQVYQAPCQDEQAERDTILGWLQTHLQAQTTPVALIVPRLEQQAPKLKRWLQAHFPDTTLSVSFGQPLYDYPFVLHALTCLSLSTESLNRQQLQCLLTSSFIKNHVQEKAARLTLLAALPPLDTFSLASCIQLTQPTCPMLAHLLSAITPYPKEDTPFHWTIHFMQRLKQIEYPGVELNSHTYQTHQRFIECLEQLQTLTLISPLLSMQAALQTLTQLTQQTLFQPQQDPNAPIHVLGPFEAAGTCYKAAWFMGLTDDQFPGAPAPTPFIPLALQRLYHLPHTDPAFELTLAQRRLNRFQYANQQLILSYPKKNQDILNRPCPLLSPFPTLPECPIFHYPPPQDNEKVVDPSYIPLQPTEHRPRGSFLFGEQAKCAFRAFASQRLMASPLDADTTFYSLQHRGMRLHHALELFWQKTTSQTELNALTAEQCASRLTDATHLAIQTSLHNTGSQHLAPSIQKLEQDRLIRLMLASLNWETTRPYFEIDSLEKKHTLQLGPLTFHIRLDRVDKVNHTEKWVTDYKTTCPSPLPWKTPTPLEPQLLVYALIDPSITGVLFHELKKGKSTVKGITDDASWEMMREQWKAYLTQLAEAFYAGSCGAEPTHPSVCQSCSFQNLCRVL
ncbi:MAG: PD-(D/E)XK nuclease family protein [Gammaproteobacteria bacterium]|nr:PD-(D/E)XK nuclease family protein [Gammaproteobacteria bacterium]